MPGPWRHATSSSPVRLRIVAGLDRPSRVPLAPRAANIAIMASTMRVRATSTLAAAALTLGLAGGILTITATPSDALSRCTLAQWQKFAQVKCVTSGGRTQVRAAIGCTKWWSGGYVWTRYGPWVGVNETSQAACAWDETPKVSNGRVWYWSESR
jgi:hypothetical protein